MTALRIKGYNLDPLAKQKTSLKRQSFSKVIQEAGNQYVYAPIKEDVRDEPPPPEFEDPEYDIFRRLSSETARSVSTESLVSETRTDVEMKVSSINTPQCSHFKWLRLEVNTLLLNI